MLNNTTEDKMDAKQNGKLPAYGEGLQEMVDRHGNSSFANVGQGLTKREVFAMTAMQGIIADLAAQKADRPGAAVAIRAVIYADALLKELSL